MKEFKMLIEVGTKLVEENMQQLFVEKVSSPATKRRKSIHIYQFVRSRAHCHVFMQAHP